jgi:hypothetical protein
MVHWQVLVNTIMNLQIPLKAGISQLAEQILGSPEGLSSMELVYCTNPLEINELILPGVGIFLFTTMSRPALAPTQPPIQWVPGSLSLGVKQLVLAADH